MRAPSQCGETFNASCACTSRIRPRRVWCAVRSAREDRRRPQMKDTIARPAAVRVLASVPAWKVPVVAMATPVDPILTAIALDRVAYMSPSPPRSTRPTYGRSHKKQVGKPHKPMRTLTKPPAASGRMLLSKPRDKTAFGVRARRAVLLLAACGDPQCVIGQRPLNC